MKDLIILGIQDFSVIQNLQKSFDKIVIVDANYGKTERLKKKISHLEQVNVIHQAVAGKDSLIYTLLKSNNKKIYRRKIDCDYLLRESGYISIAEHVVAVGIISLLMTLIESKILEFKYYNLSVFSGITSFNPEILAALFESSIPIDEFLIKESDVNSARVLKSKNFTVSDTHGNIISYKCKRNISEIDVESYFTRQLNETLENLKHAILNANSPFEINRILVGYSPLINLLGLVEDSKRLRSESFEVNSEEQKLKIKIRKLIAENNYLRFKYK